MKRPWLKFYPADWRADPRLRMCSLAARGLWIDLISYMHEGEPYGHLTIGGMKILLPDIPSLLGRPQREVEGAFAELVSRGVIAVTEAGLLHSRRMVRDKVKEERDQANGNQGGNPNLPTGVNPPINGGDKAHILEARSESERKKESGAVASATRTTPDAFDRLWKVYPSRGKSRNPKHPARQRFNLLVKGGIDPEAIISGAQRYRETIFDTGKQATEFVAMAITWLEDRSWEDYAPAPGRSAQVFVFVGTPQWLAWQGTRSKAWPQTEQNGKAGWWFPSEYPQSAELAA